jgi:hypothetical protein
MKSGTGDRLVRVASSVLIYYLRNSSRAATIFGGGLPSLLGLRAKPALGREVAELLMFTFQSMAATGAW